MDELTSEQMAEEVRRCLGATKDVPTLLEGFIYFCENYVFIEDKESRQPILFRMYPCQERLASSLVAGENMYILKARRLGITWEIVALFLWEDIFFSNRNQTVINQEKMYAEDFIGRMYFVWQRLPEWMRRNITKKNKNEMEWNDDLHNSWIRSLAAGSGAGKSMAGDRCLIDEAAEVKDLTETREAIEPTIETAGGQMIFCTTSSGPHGNFYDSWNIDPDGWKSNEAGPDGYKRFFFSWRERPGRDEFWYEKEKAKRPSEPMFMKRNYPNTPKEAYEAAELRVFALFSDTSTFIQKIPMNPSWKLYRSIDWGGTDPFVCLWIAAIRDEELGITIDPSCVNTIREMMAYHRHKNPPHDPVDKYNHTCDAIRYAVMGLNLMGHVHVYRELYIENTVDKGIDVPSLADMVRETSGEERFISTIADRSRNDSILQFCHRRVPCFGNPKLGKEGKKSEIEQGIDRINNLIIKERRWYENKRVKPNERWLSQYSDVELKTDSLKIRLKKIDDKLDEEERRFKKGRTVWRREWRNVL